MIYYLTHAYDGKKDTFDKVRQLVIDFQEDDWENCYVCPILAFPHCDSDEADNLNAIRLDLLSVCDVLIVADEPDDHVKVEVEFAKSVGMETYYV